MQTDIIAKIAAYKAFRLGREAIAAGEVGELADAAKHCLTELDRQATTVQTLDRRMFYTLILAELYRSCDPMRYREEAWALARVYQFRVTRLDI